MAFDNLEDLRTGRRLSENVPVMVAIYTSVKGRPSLTIRLNTAVIEKLGWKLGDTLTVSEGHGPDERCLQLSKSETVKGYTLSLWSGVRDQGVGNLKISIHRFVHHTFPETYTALEKVDYQAFGGRLLLMLPEWAEPVQKG